MRISIIILFLITLNTPSYAWVANPNFYPYEAIEDSSRSGYSPIHRTFHKKCLSFDKPAFFTGKIKKAKFRRTSFEDSTIFFALEFLRGADFHDAEFLSIAYFNRVIFNRSADFINMNFHDKVYFVRSNFLKDADFHWVYFHDTLDIGACDFKKDFRFWNSISNSYTKFSESIFEEKVEFERSTFKSKLQFVEVKFNDSVSFIRSMMGGDVSFYRTEFKKHLSLRDSEFEKELSLVNCTFDSSIDFSHTELKDSLSLIGSAFHAGLDLRYALMDSLKAIYLEDIVVEEGQLKVYWDQIKADVDFKIKLGREPKDNNEYYNKIRVIYLKLMDNFLAQGKKEESDEVKKELKEYKKYIFSRK